MKSSEFMIVEAKKGRRDTRHNVKPRNPVAKNLGITASGAGSHKDKKRDSKMGVEKHKGKSLSEQLTKGQIQDKIDHNKKLIGAARSMKNLSIIPDLENIIKKLESQLKTAPNEIEPTNTQDSTPISKGYKYDPYYEEEPDGDNVKIFHYITLPNGKRVDVDFTPYQEMTGRDISLWIKLGMPKRQGTGPLDSEELEQMARDQGVAEAGGLSNPVVWSKKERDMQRQQGLTPSGPQRLFSELADMLHISRPQLLALAKSIPGFPLVRNRGTASQGSKGYYDLATFKRWVKDNKVQEKIAARLGVEEVYDGEPDEYHVLRHQSKLDIEREITKPAHWTKVKQFDSYQAAKKMYDEMKAKYPNAKFTVSTHKKQGVAEGRAGVDDTDTVGFSVNSEAAYNAVMKRFGNYIDHDETSGIMYAPSRVWPQIEMTAFDADGEGATKDDGMAEGERNEMDTPEFQRALMAVKKQAAQGPKKTIYDPITRKYKVVPVNPKGNNNG